MTHSTPAIVQQAANDNPGGAQAVRSALTGLVGLMARADLRAASRRQAANTPRKKKEISQ